MNLVRFFEQLARKYNDIQKCGFCWTFGSPLSNSGMNATQSERGKECCVHLFLINYEIQHGFNRSPQTGLKTVEYCDHYFELKVVKHTNLGVNTFNEQPYHEISESLWSEVLEPLQNCLGCGSVLDTCDNPFEVMDWKMSVIQREMDDNYTGWKIKGRFRNSF